MVKKVKGKGLVYKSCRALEDIVRIMFWWNGGHWWFWAVEWHNLTNVWKDYSGCYVRNGLGEEWEQGDLLGSDFNNLEEHNDNSTGDNETGSDPECILKVESKRLHGRLDMGIEKKKRITNNFICVEQLCEKIVLPLIEVSCSWSNFGRTMRSVWYRMDRRSLSECDK